MIYLVEERAMGSLTGERARKTERVLTRSRNIIRNSEKRVKGGR